MLEIHTPNFLPIIPQFESGCVPASLVIRLLVRICQKGKREVDFFFSEFERIFSIEPCILWTNSLYAIQRVRSPAEDQGPTISSIIVS